MEVWQQTLTIVFVFALLGGALWLTKNRKLPGIGTRGPRRMEVIERVSLTPHHTLCLVRINGRLVTIGTAPSSCQLIEKFEGPVL
jgi:flagellar biogenesis protein FliO